MLFMLNLHLYLLTELITANITTEVHILYKYIYIYYLFCFLLYVINEYPVYGMSRRVNLISNLFQ